MQPPAPETNAILGGNTPSSEDEEMLGLVPNNLTTLHNTMVEAALYIRTACDGLGTTIDGLGKSIETLKLLQSQYRRALSTTDVAVTQLQFALDLKKTIDQLYGIVTEPDDSPAAESSAPAGIMTESGDSPPKATAPASPKPEIHEGAVDVAQLTGSLPKQGTPVIALESTADPSAIPQLHFYYNGVTAVPGYSYEMYPIPRISKKRKVSEPEAVETVDEIHKMFKSVPHRVVDENGVPTDLFLPIHSITLK
ncbi:hypothetical protein BDN72DRAFT_864085 [Pluteus cervinus]|uniref:Uncharacterized protein n=1 Tax=Pluteus cervinus TaxID=181527 RepID=A0ACD3A536_9AGAR|nr:hypothetical protein BDN72DRAFT_864085 [Pluteus cervinus]